MNAIGKSVERAIGRLQNLLGNPTLSWRGQAYACVPSTIRAGTTIEIGGIVEDITLTFVVRKLDISPDFETQTISAPQSGQSVLSYSGKEYRVVKVNESASADHYELDCILA